LLAWLATQILVAKVRGEATVFDPDHVSYFREREQRRGSLARHRSVVQPAF
jgi:hypothetical protein